MSLPLSKRSLSCTNYVGSKGLVCVCRLIANRIHAFSLVFFRHMHGHIHPERLSMLIIRLFLSHHTIDVVINSNTTTEGRVGIYKIRTNAASKKRGGRARHGQQQKKRHRGDDDDEENVVMVVADREDGELVTKTHDDGKENEAESAVVVLEGDEAMVGVGEAADKERDDFLGYWQ